MSDFHKNPAGDIYRIMDESGLTTTNLQNPAKPQKQAINDVRLNLAEKLKSYIKWRDQQVIKQQSEKTNEEVTEI